MNPSTVSPYMIQKRLVYRHEYMTHPAGLSLVVKKVLFLISKINSVCDNIEKKLGVFFFFFFNLTSNCVLHCRVALSLP